MTEKVYFKTFVSSNRESSEQLYIKIFDAIDKQKEYDEKKIIQKFLKTGINRRAFFASKLYLSQLIPKSLASFNAKNSIKSQIIHLINIADLFCEKTLYSLAQKKTKKAKYLANKYQYFLLLEDAIAVEKKFIRKIYDREEQDIRLKKNLEESRKALKNYTLEIEYYHLALELSEVYQKIGFSRSKDELKKQKLIIDNPLLKDENKVKTYMSIYYFHYCFILYYSSVNINKYKSYYHSLRLVKSLEKTPHIIKEDPSYYIVSLSILITTASSTFAYTNEIESYIEKTKAIPLNSPKIKSEKLSALLLSLPVFYINAARFEDGFKVLSDFSEEYGEDFHYSRAIAERVSYYYFALLICFGAKKYSDALKWVRLIFDIPKEKYRRDFYVHTKILNIMIHFDQGNWEVLESQIRSTYRFLNKGEVVFKFEKIILKYMRKFIMQPNRINIPAFFTELKKEIIRVLKDPNEKKIDDDLNVLYWIEGKIQGKDYAQIAKEEFEKKKKKMEQELLEHKEEFY